MAKSLEQIRQTVQTSVHGRRLGLNPTDFVVGPKDLQKQITNATSSSTGTALDGYGYHTVVTTTNDTWKLSDPVVPGIEVSIQTGSTSTGNHIISPVAATIRSSNGQNSSSITMLGTGAAITLVAHTTAKWGVKNLHGTVTLSS